MVRTCTDCNQAKPLAAFHSVSSRGQHSLKHRCISCEREYRRNLNASGQCTSCGERTAKTALSCGQCITCRKKYNPKQSPVAIFERHLLRKVAP